MDRRTTMKLFGLAGATGLAASLAGCSGDGDGNGGGDGGDGDGGGGGDGDGGDSGDGGDGDSSPSNDRSGGSITVGHPVDSINTLDPHYLDLTTDAQVAVNCVNGLLTLDENLELTGDVATDWTIEEDNTIVFQLHEGVEFHNGDPLDAEAVKYALDRLIGLDDSPNSFKLNSVDEVSTSGDHELTLHLDQPDAALFVNMEVQMGRGSAIVHRLADEYPEEYRETLSADGQSIGSGPFRVANRDFGQSITLERVDNYFEEDDDGNQLPYLDEITWDFVPEPSTMWAGVQSGDIDCASAITYEFADQGQNVNGVEIISATAGEWKTLNHLCAFPHEYPEWAVIAGNPSSEDEVTDVWEGEDDLPTFDPRVRRACSMAIDREEIMENAYFGFGSAAHGYFAPTMAWIYQEEPEGSGFYHDPERAEELLDEAGYTGDPRFSTEIVGRPEDERMMTVLEQQLSAIGIDVTLNIVQESAYWEDVYGYRAMNSIVGGAGELDPWTQWYRQLGTPERETGRGTYQKNLWAGEVREAGDEFDEIIEEDWRTLDQEDRRPIIEEGLEIIYDEHPYSMVAHLDKTKAQQEALNGVEYQNELMKFHAAWMDD